MDAISLLMALFLNLNEPCTALPSSETTISGENYQQLNYACGSKFFRVWSRYCHDGHGFWGRPFFLEETNSQQGLYVNQFGEVVTGWHVSMNDIHVPHCGT